jgi:hypothetical protein
LIYRFQRSFDTHDWTVMRTCLATDVTVDYTALRGGVPHVETADEYCNQRRYTLSNLDLQHNITNLTVTASATDEVHALCNFQIYRFSPTQPGHFHSFGTYEFIVAAFDDELRITSLTQHITRNDGDSSLHDTTATT